MPCRLALGLGLALLYVPVSGDDSGGGADGREAALRGISAAGMERHIRVLASDEFEGRAPGGEGEERTVHYLAEQFEALGLRPGGPDGSWFQEVPLVAIRSQVSAVVQRGADVEPWHFPQDFVAWSPWMREEVRIENSELVFVGYGVHAPEYGWDDYKDVDVRGRTIVMLVNDPPVPDPRNPGELDPDVFRGRAMTYYGRWTYKYEEAARRGAAAAIVVHETGPAGYPYFVVINSWGRENFVLSSPERNTNEVAVAAWISTERAEKLFRAAGSSYAEMKERALGRDFRPIPLGAAISFEVTNSLREVRSRNVIAELPGSDPARREEVVIYSAHWDHLGLDPRLTGDRVFNGALDNASGVAAMLEIARAFTSLDPAPARTVVFLAPTAEEQGLLGARHYARHPVRPLERTLANLNIDGVNVIGRSREVGVIGAGLNTLEDILARAARAQNREVRPEAEPEKGGFYRSDHFEFARVGVPALYLGPSGDDIIGRPPGYGKRRRDEYRELHYHKVTDEWQEWWDLSGAVEDARLMFLVGCEVADGRTWPEWKPGAEFRERRESMLRAFRAADP